MENLRLKRRAVGLWKTKSRAAQLFLWSKQAVDDSECCKARRLNETNKNEASQLVRSGLRCKLRGANKYSGPFNRGFLFQVDLGCFGKYFAKEATLVGGKGAHFSARCARPKCDWLIASRVVWLAVALSSWVSVGPLVPLPLMVTNHLELFTFASFSPPPL